MFFLKKNRISGFFSVAKLLQIHLTGWKSPKKCPDEVSAIFQFPSSPTPGTMLLLISYTVFPHGVRWCVFRPRCRKALVHMSYLWDNIPWNSLVHKRQNICEFTKENPERANICYSCETNLISLPECYKYLHTKTGPTKFLSFAFFPPPCENSQTTAFANFSKPNTRFRYFPHSQRKITSLCIVTYCPVSFFPQAKNVLKVVFQAKLQTKRQRSFPCFKDVAVNRSNLITVQKKRNWLLFFFFFSPFRDLSVFRPAPSPSRCRGKTKAETPLL